MKNPTDSSSTAVVRGSARYVKLFEFRFVENIKIGKSLANHYMYHIMVLHVKYFYTRMMSRDKEQTTEKRTER